MELKDLKALLSIQQVLQHYGLRPDKNNRLLCPFHPDKTPSLQIYPRTNTFCCFSSNCTAGTGDAIQFIELMEKCSKHEALLKAASLVQGAGTVPVQTPTAKPPAEAEAMAREAVLAKLFKYFTKALPLTKRAVDYLAGRGLDYKLHQAGYNSGDWHYKLNESHFTASCQQHGLLKARPAGGFSAWAKDCIIFPLKNEEGKIISLYGRSITNDQEQRHFYLQGRSGLYPGYPLLTTKRLILTESILDAASLLQQQTIKEQYGVLALYGTNGLTEEHVKATCGLPQLEEIVLMLNADEPGEAATAKHYGTLKQLLPQIKITHVELPAGEDVNSVLQNHPPEAPGDEVRVLADLIEKRKAFSFQPPPVIGQSPMETEGEPASPAPVPPQAGKLNTQNPERLLFDNCELCVEVLGGIRITGLDRMKVTLKVLHKERLDRPQWYSFDLYNQVQREGAISSIAESFEVGATQTAQTFTELTAALEQHRLQKIEALQPKPEAGRELTAAQRQAAITELKKPNLLERTAQMIAQSGLVGEQTNALVAYLVYATRKQPVPLHVMFLGASGSGKTYLQEKISELMPPEDRIGITQITENALYYFKQEELKHKLILIEDLDGAQAVFYPLRELQTKRRISKTVTLKDSKGNLKTITLTVEGPVCVSGCTTKEKIYEDNANRCLLLYTDQSREQDERINDYQARMAAGEVDRQRESRYSALFQNIQRVLRPITIVNPYAKYIRLPEQVFRPRRTMTLLLGFMEAVTFYHQYQREIKRDAAGQPYIETAPSDIEAAFHLLKDVLFAKSDELSKATRDFLEKLKQLAKESGTSTFNAKAIREQLRINPGNMKRYLAELVRYGYIKAEGNRYRKGSYEYTIVNPEEYETLKSSVEGHLQAVLQAIRNHGGKEGG